MNQNSLHSAGAFEKNATRITFFMAGFATAVWAALVPYAKVNAGVDEGTLGLLLLCLGGGALIAMPLTGMLTSKFGCRSVLTCSVLIFSLMLPVLSSISSIPLLVIALLAFGVGIGTTDCAMNMQAVIVERSLAKNMMSGFHGLYSVGGIVGAGIMSLLLIVGLSPQSACIILTVCLIATLFFIRKGLFNFSDEQDGPAFAIPKGTVLVLGFICFIIFLTEGTVLDWSAVFLTEYRSMPEQLGGLGFACFSALMTLGRLTGDKLVSLYAPYKIVVIGAVIAAIGLTLSLCVPYWPIALVGYGLIGIGCANIAPIMFSAAGKQKSMPQSIAIPAITTLAYTGVLAGPALIGFIAHQSTLPIAFLFVVFALILVALISTKITVLHQK
ncbi:MFS transporter [Zymobacter sp. IVIA_5232.4 C2]|uniref:MFS transporter n=1 Tax=Zymobacter sp. IVIA_5232.4 C2 TaxID=3394855 RepID=UPI0039C1CBDD